MSFSGEVYKKHFTWKFWSIVNTIWSSIIKNGLVQIDIKYLVDPSQKDPTFGTRKMKNGSFPATKMKTSFDKLVGHSNIHTYTKYEIIWGNYHLKLAITSAIWLESQEPSYSIAHFEKTFFNRFALFQLC